MEELKSKKLLVLGGNALSCDIVTTAQRMGIYTIVTDWNDATLSPAKKIADEAWNISLTDYDTLTKKIKEYGIDGIFTNYTDSYLIPYAKLCNLVGLPCLANEYQIHQISEKDKSKQMCIRNGIGVSDAILVDDDNIDKLLDKVNYPVLTKPVDQSGQRGIYVCNNVEDLKKYYPISKEFSASGRVMLEQYLQGDYVVMFFTIQDGHVTLSTMADKPVTDVIDPNQVKLPKLYILPSQYIDNCREQVLPGVQSFVDELGLKNGVIGIEAIVNHGNIHVFEMQFRLGGMRHHEFVLKENGMDLMQMLITYAVTGKFGGWDTSIYDNPDFNHTYGLLNVLVNTGQIGTISGIEQIRSKPYVKKITMMSNEGDTIKLPATVQQILCKVSIEASSRDELMKYVEDIYNTIDVKDINGDDMLLRVYEFQK